IHPSRILLTGSPMKEVLDQNRDGIEASSALAAAGLERNGYFLVSLHREENVDNPDRLRSVLDALRGLRESYGIPVLVSTHPRTRKRLADLSGREVEGLDFHAPFGFHDYVRLQLDARLVL